MSDFETRIELQVIRQVLKENTEYVKIIAETNEKLILILSEIRKIMRLNKEVK